MNIKCLKPYATKENKTQYKQLKFLGFNDNEAEKMGNDYYQEVQTN